MSEVGDVAARNHNRILVELMEEFFRSGEMRTDGSLVLSRSSTEKAVGIISNKKLSDSEASRLQKDLMTRREW